MNKHRLEGAVRKDAVLERLESDGDVERIRITTNAVDRMGDIIEADGWELANYLRNPVVLWAHDGHGWTPAGGVPIATTLGIEQDDEGLIARFVFREAANDADFVNVVRSAWEQNVLRAASVGFRALEWEALDESSDQFWGPFRITQADLYEWSIVSVPANQDALRLAYEGILKSAGLPIPPESRQLREEMARAGRISETLKEPVARLTLETQQLNAALGRAERALEILKRKLS